MSETKLNTSGIETVKIEKVGYIYKLWDKVNEIVFEMKTMERRSFRTGNYILLDSRKVKFQIAVSVDLNEMKFLEEKGSEVIE